MTRDRGLTHRGPNIPSASAASSRDVIGWCIVDYRRKHWPSRLASIAPMSLDWNVGWRIRRSSFWNGWRRRSRPISPSSSFAQSLAKRPLSRFAAGARVPVTDKPRAAHRIGASRQKCVSILRLPSGLWSPTLLASRSTVRELSEGDFSKGPLEHLGRRLRFDFFCLRDESV
jgi:hypothetical protein